MIYKLSWQRAFTKAAKKEIWEDMRLKMIISCLRAKSSKTTRMAKKMIFVKIDHRFFRWCKSPTSHLIAQYLHLCHNITIIKWIVHLVVTRVSFSTKQLLKKKQKVSWRRKWLLSWVIPKKQRCYQKSKIWMSRLWQTSVRPQMKVSMIVLDRQQNP